MAQFGELLAELRKDCNLSQKDLAKIIHVTSGTISNYENGVHLPDIEKLVEIATYFNVTTDYLLGRCSTRLSPDIWNRQITPGQTAAELIETLQTISPEQKHAIDIILKDMRLNSMLNSFRKKETT